MAISTNISTTLSNNQKIAYNGISTQISNNHNINDLLDFFELVLIALGYEITYNDFVKMEKEERIKLIRDIKLKTII
jgi:hypothetical protein